MTTSAILLVRHGTTPWNEARRIQGHTDVALADAARRDLAGRRLPDRYRHFVWHASPLGRAAETARLLGATDPRLDPRLMEMDWGEWEGRTREEIRAELGAAMDALEARGPGFRPPGGESPRDVQARVLSWAADLGPDTSPAVAATHKGVIKAALGLATGWDLTGKAPVRLRWNCAHLFEYDARAGRIGLRQANIELVPRPGADAPS